jgi:SP family sugar:H+ symporter-like MFS transporter
MITFGIFLAAVFNYAAERHQSGKSASWRITMGLTFVWPAILGFGMLFFAETPRFNFRHGKVDKAKKTMTEVYGVGENHYSIQMELEEMRMKFEAEDSVKLGAVQEWIGMWRAPKMAYRIAIGMGLQMFQQLTGANVSNLANTSQRCTNSRVIVLLLLWHHRLRRNRYQQLLRHANDPRTPRSLFSSFPPTH